MECLLEEFVEFGIDKINELRNLYLRFFEERGHLIYPSAPVKSDDPTLMFTAAGMVQFKPYFLGATPRFAGYDGIWHRVSTSQKCLRINDIENVGRTLRHHSFFEMLGNFSFGDYFKSDAAKWAWEFATSPEWLGLDPNRMYVTIYNDDDEAFDVWANEVGVPVDRISRWGEDDNFWPANAVSEGPNGPCGPCSELFYDRGDAFGTPDEVGPNTGSGDRYIEFWNLVFTQFDRQDGGTLEPLPQKNIDTGLGFERLVAIMSGAEDAYATELFQPTIRRLVERSGKPYEGASSTSHRVVADHVRAIAFAISDGVLPANDGAGYVIKMLTRRASRHAYLLGIQEPVLYTLLDGVVESMGEAYPDLKANRDRIARIIQAEEEQFLRTLAAGIERVNHLLDTIDGSELDGAVAFDLWETFGFPIDLTEELAGERNVTIDRGGYQAARERARDRSRAAEGQKVLFQAGSKALDNLANTHGETPFTGYTTMSSPVSIIGVLNEDASTEQASLSEGQDGIVILTETPFYPEGGGQVSDEGKLTWNGGQAQVRNVKRAPNGIVLHSVRVQRGTLTPNSALTAHVDPHRVETEKHHTATHLLHAALQDIVGKHVAQAGSLVNHDRLRFDFTSKDALTNEQKTAIEARVNTWIQQNLSVVDRTVSITQAREAGAMMLFGEKYGENVRMVEIGDDVISRELCGGTHVAHTGTLGVFVLVNEEAAAAGVRRVEARVGKSSLAWLNELRERQLEAAKMFGAGPDQLLERLEKVRTDHRSLEREYRSLEDRFVALQTSGGGSSQSVTEAGKFTLAIASLDNLAVPALRNAADTLLDSSKADVVAVVSEQLLILKATKSAVENGVHAGNIIKEITKTVSGRGGGKADMAQAGFADAAAAQEALGMVAEQLKRA